MVIYMSSPGFCGRLLGFAFFKPNPPSMACQLRRRGGSGTQTAQKTTSTVGLLALRAAAFGRTQPHPRRRFRTRRLDPFPPTAAFASIPLRATKRNDPHEAAKLTTGPPVIKCDH